MDDPTKPQPACPVCQSNENLCPACDMCTTCGGHRPSCDNAGRSSRTSSTSSKG